MDAMIRELKEELDAAHNYSRQLECEMDEYRKTIAMAEEDIKAAEEIIDAQHDRIRFLEGQVDAYQYVLNCRR